MANIDLELGYMFRNTWEPTKGNCTSNRTSYRSNKRLIPVYGKMDWEQWRGPGRRLTAAIQLRVNRTALPFSYPYVTPQSQSLPSNRFVRFTL
ncbi:hypothetical protein J6590_093241 [Homalodisca vitripennis]|nr:hypothetical protein J6590_093241 [Homalodisca vitripennis]